MGDAERTREATRLVIVEAIENKMTNLRKQEEAIDRERGAVLAELAQLRKGGVAAAVPGDARRGAGRAVAMAFQDEHVFARRPEDAWVPSHLGLEVHGSPSVREHVDLAWRACSETHRRVRQLVLGADDGDSALVVHEDGQAWTAALPELMRKAVHDRTRGGVMPVVVHAAMGRENRFYLRYADGLHDWLASPACSEHIRRKPVESVAFGPNFSSFCIIHRDGSLSFEDLPAPCEACLARRSPQEARVQHVALGPEGEWWIRFMDGSQAYGGVGSDLSNRLLALDKAGTAAVHVSFGAGGTWVLTHALDALQAQEAASERRLSAPHSPR